MAEASAIEHPVQALVMVVISASAGPYWVGKISTLTGSLTYGLVSLQVLTPIALVLLIAAGLRLGFETPERRRARAEAAGEPSLIGQSN
jgi:hypothetical protein